MVQRPTSIGFSARFGSWRWSAQRSPLASADGADVSRRLDDVVSGIDLWNDGVRIEQFQLDFTLDLLCAGGNVVVEWGIWAREEREVLRDAARASWCRGRAPLRKRSHRRNVEAHRCARP